MPARCPRVMSTTATIPGTMNQQLPLRLRCRAVAVRAPYSYLSTGTFLEVGDLGTTRTDRRKQRMSIQPHEAFAERSWVT